MSVYFAKLDNNNVVLSVESLADAVVNNLPFPASEVLGVAFLRNLYNFENWRQTSPTGEFRKRYTGIGYAYDMVRDAFIEPKPYESWLLNNDTCAWEAPVPMPNDGHIYVWNDASGAWVKLW